MNRLKRPKTIVLILALLILAGLIGWFLIASQTSVKGTIKNSGASKERASTEIKPVTLDGKYFTMVYPGTYAKSGNQPDKNSLEQHKLAASTFYEKFITITVKRLPSGRLDDDGSYKLRKTVGDQYTEEVKVLNGQTIHWFTKVDKTERDAFLVKNGMVATIVLSSSSSEDDLVKEADELLKTFKWKN